MDLINFIQEQLSEFKAQDIIHLDVSKKSSITDHMIIGTGSSVRNVAAIAEQLAVACKKADIDVFSTSGEQTGDWVIVDLGHVIVHIMQQESRDLYQLEKLWG